MKVLFILFILGFFSVEGKAREALVDGRPYLAPLAQEADNTEGGFCYDCKPDSLRSQPVVLRLIDPNLIKK